MTTSLALLLWRRPLGCNIFICNFIQIKLWGNAIDLLGTPSPDIMFLPNVLKNLQKKSFAFFLSKKLFPVYYGSP